MKKEELRPCIASYDPGAPHKRRGSGGDIGRCGLYVDIRVAQNRYGTTAEMADALIWLFGLDAGVGGVGAFDVVGKAFDRMDKGEI